MLKKTDITYYRLKVPKGERIPVGLYEKWLGLIESQPQPVNPLVYPEYTLQIAQVQSNVEIGYVLQGEELVALFSFQREGKGAVDIGGIVSDQSVWLLRPGSHFDLNRFFKELKINHWQFAHLPYQTDGIGNSVQLWDDCFGVDLAGGIDVYLDSLKAKKSKVHSDVRRRVRKLERDFGEITFEAKEVSADSIEKLIEFKNEQLVNQYQDDTLQQEWVKNLIGNLVNRSSMGMLSTLRVEGEIVAAQLGMVSNESKKKTYNAWMPAVNPAFQTYSPGLILNWQLIHFLAEDGYCWMELGRGSNQLKRRLANKVVKMGVGRHGCNFTWNTVSKVERWLRQGKQNWPKLFEFPKSVTKFFYA